MKQFKITHTTSAHHALKRLTALALSVLLLLMPVQSVLAAGTGTDIGADKLEEKISESVLLYLGSNLARVRGTLAPIDIGRNGTAPFIHENRTMVPIRFLAESVGGIVSYDAKTSTATISLEGYNIAIRTGDRALRVNGISILMEVAPIARNGRIYAPLRAVAEAFGMGVFYDRGLIAVAPGPVWLDKDAHKAFIDEQIRALGMVQVAKSEADLLAQLKAWQGDVTRNRYAEDMPVMLTDEAFTQAESTSGAADKATAPSAQTTSPQAPATNDATTASPESADDGSSESTAGSDTHGTTNTQVAGVDEGDILKTDGTYLYQINRMRVMIIQALPADGMKLLATIQLGAENVFPEEIYLADGRLTIIGAQSHHRYPIDIYDAPTGVKIAPTTNTAEMEAVTAQEILPMPPMPMETTTRVVTFDVSNPRQPTRLGSYEIEGRLLSSRRVGNALYLVTNKSLSYRMPYDTPQTPVFRYGAGVQEGSWQPIPATTVSWCPDFTNANYLVVSGIQLDKPSLVPSQYTMLGAGDTIYATADALFVAVRQYKHNPIILPEPMMERMPPSFRESTETTDLYRFTLEAGTATLVSRGSIPGRLLNQFSMDWHADHLRVATTLGWASRTVTTTPETGVGTESGTSSVTTSDSYATPTSTNQLFVLDEMMNVTGAILDIAPGEQIYSTRFMGERGYMVTYKDVDPLYVLDLADPRNPAILGELKIPGYSTYLHPYQEGYLIGFGKDSVELVNQWDPTTKWAYYQGLKVALFDVRDVASPKLLHETHIGDRGTDSELLRNHRALLFSPTRNLMAFPVSLYEVPVGEDALISYGTFTWQGLMAYRLTVEKGFEKLVDISHLEPGDSWNSERYVTRGTYIGDTLYSLSNREIRATDMNSWQEVGRLVLP